MVEGSTNHASATDKPCKPPETSQKVSTMAVAVKIGDVGKRRLKTEQRAKVDMRKIIRSCVPKYSDNIQQALRQLSMEKCTIDSSELDHIVGDEPEGKKKSNNSNVIKQAAKPKQPAKRKELLSKPPPPKAQVTRTPAFKGQEKPVWDIFSQLLTDGHTTEAREYIRGMFSVDVPEASIAQVKYRTDAMNKFIAMNCHEHRTEFMSSDYYGSVEPSYRSEPFRSSWDKASWAMHNGVEVEILLSKKVKKYKINHKTGYIAESKKLQTIWYRQMSPKKLQNWLELNNPISHLKADLTPSEKGQVAISVVEQPQVVTIGNLQFKLGIVRNIVEVPCSIPESVRAAKMAAHHHSLASRYGTSGWSMWKDNTMVSSSEQLQGDNTKVEQYLPWDEDVPLDFNTHKPASFYDEVQRQRAEKQFMYEQYKIRAPSQHTNLLRTKPSLMVDHVVVTELADSAEPVQQKTQVETNVQQGSPEAAELVDELKLFWGRGVGTEGQSHYPKSNKRIWAEAQVKIDKEDRRRLTDHYLTSAKLRWDWRQNQQEVLQARIDHYKYQRWLKKQSMLFSQDQLYAMHWDDVRKSDPQSALACKEIQRPTTRNSGRELSEYAETWSINDNTTVTPEVPQTEKPPQSVLMYDNATNTLGLTNQGSSKDSSGKAAGVHVIVPSPITISDALIEMSSSGMPTPENKSKLYERFVNICDDAKDSMERLSSVRALLKSKVIDFADVQRLFVTTKSGILVPDTV